ncbi:hypothetical protein CK203_106462 [Vitis vinifera]|uniref:DUF4283 domain-containing protein n=1 Tax=Vitis vinifera TaxID=29760 RepID=A0A438CAT1_VITVI|nr:hypothetical protein CK203_106462 [Vitis vinifera]
MELGSHGEIGGKEELGEAIWIQFGREDLKINVEHLKHCLVGSWVDPAVEGNDFFKRVDDACGSFVVVDVDTTKRHHLQWARILVSYNGRRVPRILHVVVAFLVFAYNYGGRYHRVGGLQGDEVEEEPPFASGQASPIEGSYDLFVNQPKGSFKRLPLLFGEGCVVQKLPLNLCFLTTPQITNVRVPSADDALV